MATSTDPKPKAKDDAIYFCDNGATYCGKHLGMTARYTLRDTSGQRILKATPAHAAAAKAQGWTLNCECCKKEVTS